MMVSPERLWALRVGDEFIFPGFSNPPTPPVAAPAVRIEAHGGHAQAAFDKLEAKLRRLVDEGRARSADGRVTILDAGSPNVTHCRNNVFLAEYEFGLYYVEKT